MISNYSKRLPLRVKATAGDNLNYFLHLGGDQQINFVFYLKERVDAQVLKKAARLAFNAEPILACKYVKGWWRAYWVLREDIDSSDYFQLIETAEPQKAIKKFVLSEIDPTVDILVKIRLFRAEKDIIVIKSEHTVMDGGGFYDYLTLLCNIYNGLLGKANFEVKANWPPKRGLRQVFKHYNFFKKMKSLLWERGFKPTWSFPSTGKGKEKRNFLLRKIEPERLERIKAYGKQYQATINDIFLTAAFRALFQLHEKKPRKKMTIAVPTDLRVLMPEKKAQSIANLVASTFVSLKYRPEDTFSDNLQDISKQMKKKKKIYLGLGEMFVINAFFKLNYSMVSWLWKRIHKGLCRRKKVHPIITNVGRIDAKERHFGATEIEDAHIITPVNWAPSFSMGISSYKNKFTLSIGYCEDSYATSIMEKFFDILLEELPK